MHKFLLFLFSFFFLFSACTVLKSGDSFEEDSYTEEEFSDEVSEGDEYGDEEDEDFGEEDEYGEEEGEYDDEEDEYFEGDAEKKGGIGGFFSRLFGASSDDDEEDDGDYEDEQFSTEDSVEEGSYSDYDTGEASEGSEAFSESSVELEADSSEGENTSETVESTQDQTDDQPAQTETPSFIPLNKIISAPYKKAGYLVNAVYIARPDDTLESISQKIYGYDQVSVLYTVNPHLQSRSVKVGDKIYYNSPSRENDSSRLLFYYQDINAPSSLYTLSPGDNIRAVSSKLLGHPNSWKEIWATNPDLVSKGEIANRMDIIYWPVGSGPVSMPSPASPAVEETPQNPDIAQPEMDLNNELAPPPMEPHQETQQEKPQNEQKVNLLQILLEQKEIVLALLAIIVILILMIRLILKKRKQRDFDYTATNIEV